MEFDGGPLAFAQMTREHPGSTVDLISEPMEIDGKPGYLGVFLVRGVGDTGMKRIEKELTRRYEAPRTLRRDHIQRQWLARIHMKAEAMKGPAAEAFLSISQHWGVPWVRYEDGILMVRARVNDPGEAEHVARELRERMANGGVEAQVEIQEVAPRDFGVWRELVDASLGLTS